MSAGEKSAPRPKSASAFTIVVARSIEELIPYADAWDDLARNALEPNVFYESWMLLPALRAYKSPNVMVVLVFSNLAPQRHGKPLLCGLLPLERHRYPFVHVLRLWNYIHWGRVREYRPASNCEAQLS
ncbi:MAG: hypothetical protein FJ271_22660 [Planctomycetes bacterium]|nr:hypothetical protein [Planctomycetota bacterium]